MSYRNPTYYGIVEDVGAFNDAFQQSFGKFKSMVDADLEEKKKQELINNKRKGQDINTATQIAQQIPLEWRSLVKEDIMAKIEKRNYSDLDDVERAKLNSDLVTYSETFMMIPEAIKDPTQFEDIDEGMVTTILQYSSGDIKPKRVEGKGIMLGDYTLPALVAAFKQQNILEGNAEAAGNTEFKLLNEFEKDLAIENKNYFNSTGQNMTRDQITEFAGKFMQGNKRVIQNPENDWVWKYRLEDEDKKMTLPNGEEISLVNQGYNLNKLVKQPEIQKNALNARDIQIGNYYTNFLGKKASMTELTKPGGGEEGSEANKTAEIINNQLLLINKKFKPSQMSEDGPGGPYPPGKAPFAIKDISGLIKSYNIILKSTNNKIEKDPDDGKYYIYKSSDSYGGEAGKIEVDIFNLDELRQAALSAVAGKSGVKYFNVGLPTNK